jgi:glycosyltransferase involved in cell wall biosynthesis
MGLAAGMAQAGARVDLLCPWSPSLPRRPFTHRGVDCMPHFFAANALLALPDEWLPSAVAHSLGPIAPGPRRRLRRAAEYDVVQFELCAYPAWMERLRRGSRPPRLVYSAHNVEQDLFRGRSGPRYWRRPMLARVADLERRTVVASDLVVTCTEDDALRMAELYGAPRATAVVPNGFDESLTRAREDAVRRAAREKLGIAPHETTLIFIGGRAHHNQQAVELLEGKVLPELPQAARLLIVGEVADASPGRGAARQQVIRLGHVADLAGPLAAADVGVNPVTYGSGSNLKLADYLAAGLPVVSTPVGARGYERSVRLAGPDDFAAAVQTAVAEGTPEAVDVERTWSALGRSLLALYELPDMRASAG